MAAATMKVGRWDVPVNLFSQYVRLIGATERSAGRYTYEFDAERQNIHDKIIDHLGLMPHTHEYRDFQRALRDSCEEMLPARYPQPKATKLTPPVRGLLSARRLAEKE